MKIAIISVSFNQRKFLSAAIDSVLCQEGDIEYVIVDPGSTDGSRDVISEYASIDRRIKAVFEKDSGPADGLNRGLSIITAPIFGYLNSDDLYLPGALRFVCSYFSAHQDVTGIYGHGGIINELGDLKRRVRSHRFSVSAFLGGTGSIVQQATFFRSDAVRMVGGFNVKNKSCWDGELLLDLALAGYSLERVNRYLGLFRIYPESITGSNRLADAYACDRDRMREKAIESVQRARARHDVLSRILQIVADPIRLPVRCVDELLGAGAAPWLDGWPGLPRQIL